MRLENAAIDVTNNDENTQQLNSFETSFEFCPTADQPIDCDHAPAVGDSNDFFSTFMDKIGTMNLLEKDIDKVYGLCLSLVKHTSSLNQQLMKENNGFSPLQV